MKGSLRAACRIALLAALQPLAPSPGPLARPEAPQLVAGPMVGHVGPRWARIWLQGDRAGWLAVELRARGSETWRRPIGPAGRPERCYLDPEDQLAAVCELRGLEPATDYLYRLVSSEGPLAPESEQSFRTPPPPGTPEDFTVAFGSCASHWGPEPEQPVFRAVDTLRPEVFLWLGDNVYYEREEREWTDLERMAARWRRQRSIDALQPLLRRTAHYAIWDDHDYGPNDSDKLYPLKHASLALFADYWANPAYAPGGGAGVYHRFQRGRVEFFMLDGRFHRDPNWMEPGPEKTLLGREQWRWLERVLAESTADFKVIVSSNQVLARYHDFESWNRFPADRARLLGLLRDEEVNGVVLLSGDRHAGEVLRWLPPEVPYPLYEFTCSPLSAGVAPPLPDEEVADRLPGSAVAAEHFGLLRFELGGRERARLTFQARGADGSLLNEPVTLAASELQP